MEKKECEEITTEGPSFFQIVTAPLTADFLRIPSCFVKHIEEEAEDSVALRGRSGVGNWHVKLERNADGLFLRDGWKDFHRDNSLKEGEFLLFRYDGAMVFTVRIFKMSGLERDVRHPLIPPQTASLGCSKNPLFMSHLKSYNLSKSLYLSVLRSFGEEHFEATNGIIKLRNHEGKVWKVNYICNGGNHVLGGGWCKFVRDNKLKEGNVCVFELVNKNEMQVYIS